MKLRSVAIACAFVLALYFAKSEEANAGTYISVNPYGVHLNVGYGHGYGYYPSRRYYQPYYGYRSSYYRPYRKHYYGTYYYPSNGYNYTKRRYRRRHVRRHYRRHYRRNYRHVRRHHRRRHYYRYW